MASEGAIDGVPPDYVQALRDMGFPTERATLALLMTGCNFDAAVSWLFDNPEESAPVQNNQASDRALQLLAAALQRAPADGEDEAYKMVLCVRQDLKMRGGKVPAQCVHAALGAYREAMERQPQVVEAWEESGEATVVVKLQSEEEMMKVAADAEAAGLVNYIVMDAGRTQIAAGSKTVLAIGPGKISQVDAVTGHLKLL
eukprot:TRINITY_DN1792_c0_g1_i1.p1 TRINITY_DN1792_c0_g1~~TRINITY_DN1792_c0_g1_i1.p1  ORF type:complete len:200 (-),score=43.65 TRINITY_DN1792_c0_g1_i1:58-657(-)